MPVTYEELVRRSERGKIMFDIDEHPILTMIGISVLVLAIVAIGVVVVAQLFRPISVNQCNKFAEVSGYETKFVDYNIVSYDCLAKKADGRWISTEKLREIE